MQKIPPIIFIALAAYYPIRVVGFVAHLIILIYELAAKPWDDVGSSLMIVTALFLVACLAIAVLLILRSDTHMTELGKARMSFLASLAQATGIVGLFVAWVLVVKHRPNSLLVIHPFNIFMCLISLGINSQKYHKGRLAGPNSSFHIPFNALVVGDFDRMRAARPDYTRKSRRSSKKVPAEGFGDNKGKGEDDGPGTSDTSLTKKAGSAQGFVLTSGGDIMNGLPGGDERRWWEKW